MEHNILDGWLALAAETKRVDRLSSSLGLDSPALQNSPSSMGSSCGSSGLNTPSQNAFRFLPFLHDISPDLLKNSSLKLGPRPSSLSRERSHSHLSPSPPRVPGQRRPGPVHSLESPMRPDWRKRRTTSQSIVSPKTQPVGKQRPSIHNSRHMSYPAWPSPKPAPLTLNLPLIYDGRHENPSMEMGRPSIGPSERGPSRHVRRNLEPSYMPGLELGQARDGPVSPMLSEPFHRLIMKDEEEFVDLGGMLSDGNGMGEDGEMKTVLEEEEDLTNWWENDSMRDFNFEFDAAPTLPPYGSRTLLQDQHARPWAIPK